MRKGNKKASSARSCAGFEPVKCSDDCQRCGQILMNALPLFASKNLVALFCSHCHYLNEVHSGKTARQIRSCDKERSGDIVGGWCRTDEVNPSPSRLHHKRTSRRRNKLPEVHSSELNSQGLGRTISVGCWDTRGTGMAAVIKLRSSDEPVRVDGEAEQVESLNQLVVKDKDGRIRGEFSLDNVESWFNEA